MEGSVRKKSDTWYYCFDVGKVGGKRKRIERKGGKTKKEALVALREAIREYEKCGSVIDESNLSISDYFDYWYKEYVLINCKYNTQTNYKTIIEKHIKPNLGIYKLKAISAGVLQEFLNKKFLNGLTKNTVSGFYGVLSGAFKSAVYPYQYLKENPMTYVSMPKYNEVKTSENSLKIISSADFKRIINRFPASSNFYIPLMIGFNTGMRAAEVCGLTWDCVDLENKIIKVEKILVYQNKEWVFGTPKTFSSQRDITIGKTLLQVLKTFRLKQMANKLEYGEHYTKSNFVCTKENGENITSDSLKYLSRVINYELKISFNFHSLRHTHATMLLASGANFKDIQIRLGHSKLATTMDTYAHITKDMKVDAIDKFEDHLSAILK